MAFFFKQGVDTLYKSLTKLIGKAFFLLFLFSGAAAAEKIEIPIAELTLKITDKAIVLHKKERLHYNSQLVPDPPRYVFDIIGIKGRYLTKHLHNHPTISSVRIAPHPRYTRIVFDLKVNPLKTEVVDSSKTITIRIITASEEPPPSVRPVQEPLPRPGLQQPKEEAEIPEAPERVQALPVSPGDQEDLRREEVADPKPPEESKEKTPRMQEVELRFSVSDLIVTFPYGSRTIRDVTVKNRSQSKLFMTALAERVIEPGMAEERREPAKTLLVSPRRFELATGQERLVRLVLTDHDAENEAVFRVNFIPDAEPFEVQAQKPMQVRLNAGLSALVVAMPRDPHAELVPQWEEDQVVLHNAGNTNVYLDRGKVCDLSRCAAVPAKRIYSSANWIIRASGLQSIEFLKKVGNEFENILIKRDES